MYERPYLKIESFRAYDEQSLARLINSFGEINKIHYVQTHIINNPLSKLNKDMIMFIAFVFYEVKSCN